MKYKLVKSGLLLAFLSPLLLAVPVMAATAINIGNGATTRSATDTYSNFTIIDTNMPASGTGTLTAFNYYAANTNPFEFVLVDSAGVVQWISPTITPSGTGVQVYTPASPVTVSAGWNLGAHFDLTGTIPFDSTGSPANYTANGSGTPAVSSTLTYQGFTGRIYSFNATGTVVDSDSSDNDGDNDGHHFGQHRGDHNGDGHMDNGWHNKKDKGDHNDDGHPDNGQNQEQEND